MYNHSPENPWYWLIWVIVSIAIAWLALSVLLIWAKPAFFNDDGSLNWWTTLWVAVVQLIFVFIIWLVISLIWKAFASGDACAPKCPPKLDSCGRPIM